MSECSLLDPHLMPHMGKKVLWGKLEALAGQVCTTGQMRLHDIKYLFLHWSLQISIRFLCNLPTKWNLVCYFFQKIYFPM